jgi:plasmid replication initiation protein
MPKTIIKRNKIQEVQDMRTYKVVKSNDLVQKARFSLSAQEQKIILYIISTLKPDNTIFPTFTFKISDFCRICGLNSSGANYNYIRQALKKLRDKSIWIPLENGEEGTFAWFDAVRLSAKTGTVTVTLSSSMAPYLLQLKEHFTNYELIYTLAMKSQYSIRLYEILKSYEFKKQKIFYLDFLKENLSAENYKTYSAFKQNVLDICMKEINNFSDINVKFEGIKEGRKIVKIKFSIGLKKNVKDRLKTWENISQVIDRDGQTKKTNSTLEQLTF